MFLCQALHFAVAIYTTVVEAILDCFPFLHGQGRFGAGLSQSVEFTALIARCGIFVTPLPMLFLIMIFIALIVGARICNSRVTSAHITFTIFLSQFVAQSQPTCALIRSTLFSKRFTHLNTVLSRSAATANSFKNGGHITIALCAMAGLLVTKTSSTGFAAALTRIVALFSTFRASDHSSSCHMSPYAIKSVVILYHRQHI